MRRSLLALLTAVALGLLLVACGEDGGGSGSGGGKPEATQAERQTTAAGCRRVDAPEPASAAAEKPTQRLDPRRTWTVDVVTSCGDFTIELDVKRAPRTTSSFGGLARDGFYDGLTFHRVSRGFVIQGGDPQGDGLGGPGYSTREAPPAGLRYTRGLVAMAKAGTEPPGTAGSQFFVVTAEDATASQGLGPDYALVGEVVDGLEVVDRIGSVDTDPPGDGTPLEPIVIEKMTLTGS